MLIPLFYLNFIFLFLLSHSTIQTYLEHTPLTFPMTNTEYNGYNISLSFTTNNTNSHHILSLKLNMLNNYTFTSTAPFLSRTEYFTLNKLNQTYFDYNYISLIPTSHYIANISIPSPTPSSHQMLLNFNFFINPQTNYPNSIGLSHLITNSTYSFIHSFLLNQNQIQSNTFSFVNINSSSYYFIIGEHPLFTHFKYKGICNTNTFHFKWMCYYNEIIFNNIHFVPPMNLNEIVFNSGQSETYITKAMWEFIKEVFQPFINMLKCINTKVGDHYCIRCKQGIQSDMNDFIIRIGEYVYIIPAYQMFLMYNKTNTMEFYWKYQEEHSDMFTVGTNFLSLFNVVSFDYDNDIIVFQSNNANMIITYLNYVNSNKHLKLLLLLIINMFIMFNNILIIYYIKYHKR